MKNKKHLLLLCSLLFFITLMAEEVIKFKNGTFMKGSVVKVTANGVIFRMADIDDNIEFKWDELDESTVTKIKASYRIENSIQKEIKTAEPVVPLVDDKKGEGNIENSEGGDGENFSNENHGHVAMDLHVGRRFFSSYMRHLKDLTRELTNLMAHALKDGQEIFLKDGRKYKGIPLGESNGNELKLQFNNHVITLNTADIKEQKPTKVLVKDGNVKLEELGKYCEGNLHEITMQLAANENELTIEQAQEIWKLRLSGGLISVNEKEVKFLPFRSKRSLDLLHNSFLFVNNNGRLKSPDQLEETWWNEQSFFMKQNILMSICIIKNFPKTSTGSKVCPKCKGAGMFAANEFEKGEKEGEGRGGKTKDSEEGKKEIKRGQDVSNMQCPDCRGMKRLYSIKYE